MIPLDPRSLKIEAGRSSTHRPASIFNLGGEGRVMSLAVPADDEKKKAAGEGEMARSGTGVRPRDIASAPNRRFLTFMVADF